MHKLFSSLCQQNGNTGQAIPTPCHRKALALDPCFHETQHPTSLGDRETQRRTLNQWGCDRLSACKERAKLLKPSSIEKFRTSTRSAEQISTLILLPLYIFIFVDDANCSATYGHRSRIIRCVCVNVYAHTHKYVHKDICRHVDMHTTCIYICICICMYVCRCYTHTHICLCICRTAFELPGLHLPVHVPGAEPVAAASPAVGVEGPHPAQGVYPKPSNLNTINPKSYTSEKH